ncbi:MAG: hypothetical protein K9N55_17255 [Phycisphaerae bacterium]|nr:hypothetical protein [Phycisphaerae bacterium]
MVRTRTIPIHLLVGLFLVGFMTTPCLADFSIDVKAGLQTLDNPLTLEETSRTRFEVELAGTTPASDNLEITFAFGGASVTSATDTYTSYDAFGMIQDTLEDTFRTYDFRLGLRLYPLAPPDSDSIHPYVGGGVGYYWLVDQWKDTHLETIDVPYTEFWTEDEGHTSIADGFFPYVCAGVDIPITDQAALLFEYKHDFMKKKDGANYGGNIFTAGMRFRW